MENPPCLHRNLKGIIRFLDKWKEPPLSNRKKREAQLGKKVKERVMRPNFPGGDLRGREVRGTRRNLLDASGIH